MSDEQFDDAIREALLADDPGGVPVRLRARMASIPRVERSRRAVPIWRRRRAWAAAPALGLVVLLGAVALRGAPVAVNSPSPAPASADAPTTSAAPSASASVTPSATPVPLSAIALGPKAVTEVLEGGFGLRGRLQYLLRFADTVSWPSIVQIDPSKTSDNPAFWVALAGLQNDHQIVSPQVTDAGIVWLETWYTQPPNDCTGLTGCGPHAAQPISWALHLTTFAGKTTQLDHGVDAGWQYDGIGSSATAPAIAAAGDRVAYAVPRPDVPGHADASTIIVRSLPDGRIVRRLDRDGYVPQVGVWDQALLFREAVGGAEPESADASAATLYVSPGDDRDPLAIDRNVGGATIGDGGVPGDDRIAWVSSQQGAAWVGIANIDGTVPTMVFPASSVDPSLTPVSAASPALIGDGVAWLNEATDAFGDQIHSVDAWLPHWATGRTVPTLTGATSLTTSDGRLLVHGIGLPAVENTPVGAIPAPALFAADGGQPVDMLLAERLAFARFNTGYGIGVTPQVASQRLEDRGTSWRMRLVASIDGLNGTLLETVMMTIDVDKATGVTTIVDSSTMAAPGDAPAGSSSP